MSMIKVDEKKLDQILINAVSLCDSFYITVNGKSCHAQYCKKNRKKNCPFLCEKTIKEWLRKED